MASRSLDDTLQQAAHRWMPLFTCDIEDTRQTLDTLLAGMVRRGDLRKWVLGTEGHPEVHCLWFGICAVTRRLCLCQSICCSDLLKTDDCIHASSNGSKQSSLRSFNFQG
jgi:hypothetical protein